MLMTKWYTAEVIFGVGSIDGNDKVVLEFGGQDASFLIRVSVLVRGQAVFLLNIARESTAYPQRGRL